MIFLILCLHLILFLLGTLKELIFLRRIQKIAWNKIKYQWNFTRCPKLITSFGISYLQVHLSHQLFDQLTVLLTIQLTAQLVVLLVHMRRQLNSLLTELIAEPKTWTTVFLDLVQVLFAPRYQLTVHLTVQLTIHLTLQLIIWWL